MTDWHDPNTLQVEDFWHLQVITTSKYRSFKPHMGSAQNQIRRETGETH
jgi:hypothetical protein